MTYKAKDLSPDQRAVIESLLGRRVLEDEAVSIRAIEPPAALSDERRRELVTQLTEYYAEVEAEDIITEAIRSVRPGYRPHQ